MSDNVISLAKGDDDDENNPPAPAKFEREQGVGFAMPFGAPYHGYGQVMRKDPITAKQMMEMLDTNGQARALYRLITLPIRAALKNASFIPAEGGEEEAEFIEQMFNLPPASGGMTTTFERVMAQILLGIFHGFSAFEQVYWIPTDGPLKGKITLKKLGHRPADTVTFLVDDDGHFRGIRQKIVTNGKLRDVFIPKEDVFYYAANEEERPFYGVSYFRSAFYHYDIMQRLSLMMNMAGQRAAVGFRIGTFPGNPSKAEKHDFAIALENLGFAQAMHMPEGWKVEVLKEGGTFDFLAAINYHNNQMSKSVLADFFDKDPGGSSATAPIVDFSQRTDEFFTLMLRTIMGDIAAQINHYIIPKFVKWNFDTDKYPSFQWGAFKDEQLEAIRVLFMELAPVADGSFTPEFFRALEKRVASMTDLEIDYEEVKERELAQAQAEGIEESLENQHLSDLHVSALAKQAEKEKELNAKIKEQEARGGNRPSNNDEKPKKE